MTDYGPITINDGVTYEVQGICVGDDGTTIYTNTFLVEADLSTTPPPDDCTITTQPTSQVLAVGDPVDFGGVLDGGTMVWEMATIETGPWTAATPPANLPDNYPRTYWRFKCSADDAVVSNVVFLQENIFVTANGEIYAPDGEIVTTTGGMNGAINQRTSP